MDPRSLLDDDEDDATPTQERVNVFGDEFEDDSEFDAVADGFRPQVDRGVESTVQQDNASVRTGSAQYATQSTHENMSPAPSRNSTRKSRTYLNPFASFEDDDATSADRPQSLEFERDDIARRSISSASSHVYARTNSLRFGAGPSHPYGMYQQATMARTPSTTTTSTIRAPPRQSFTQNIPQHPYALYPQGIDDGLDDADDDDDDDVQPVRQNPVPVGFPGLGQNYTRRIGPDGEDQDIIGEYGHTEQLPPYSRYPDEGPEKMPLLVPSALHSRAPVAGNDPGMSLLHDTIQPSRTPVPQSMSDASDLARHASRASSANVALLPSSSSSDESSMSAKKKWNEKTWKEKRKTRFCGIPLWWVLLALGVLFFIAVVLGGAIGGFVAGGQHARGSVMVTTLFDASPIPSPTGVAPPIGTFALTLGLPEETQDQCLPVPDQRPAWSCDLAPNAALGLVVSPGVNGSGSGANVFYASNDMSISYGVQLSYMNTSFSQFIPVQDNDSPNSGPAFYFQQYYDKVVVVPEDALSIADGSPSNNRRQASIEPSYLVPSAWRFRKQIISPGEKPWFCVWNNTFLEGFIYVEEPVSSSTMETFPTSTSMSSGIPASQQSMTPVGSPVTTPTPTPASDITSVLALPSITATYNGPASGYQAWASAQTYAAKRRRARADTPDQGHGRNKRQTANGDIWYTLNVFPYVLKLEERRIPNNPMQPYCQQYQILDSGAANWVPNPSGGPIIIDLQEQDPDFEVYESLGIASGKKSKRMVPGGCHCQWMSGDS